MPSRVIRADFVTSRSLLSVSIPARHTFTLLILTVDDYGRFDGRMPLLLSALYPLGDVKQKQLAGWLDELCGAGCIRMYVVEGAEYLCLPNWETHRGKSRRSATSKYPEPEGIPGNPGNSVQSSDFPLGVGVGGGDGDGVGVRRDAEQPASVKTKSSSRSKPKPKPRDELPDDPTEATIETLLGSESEIGVRYQREQVIDWYRWILPKLRLYVHPRTGEPYSNLALALRQWWRRVTNEDIATAKRAAKNRDIQNRRGATAAAPRQPVKAPPMPAGFGRSA